MIKKFIGLKGVLMHEFVKTRQVNAKKQSKFIFTTYYIYYSLVYAVAGLLVVVGGVQEVMRQIEFGVKLYLLLHVAVAKSN